MSLENGKVTGSAPLDSSEGRWIKLVQLTYTDCNNETRTWESAERTTRAKSSGVDGVGILAIFEKPTGSEILLQKQFRPPLNRITIELPAGLVDEGETIQQAAMRELKEETGFVGTVLETSPVMFNDPGMTNTNTAICSVKIDMELPENKNPTPNLEDDEFIESFTAPLSTLYDTCKRLQAEGYAIDTRVGVFAQGIELGKLMKL
ncbi:NUDIX domain-containing protein [Xylaria intraflava]|nr:NUDIX domain-containing protein [Xylaria intraflava]